MTELVQIVFILICGAAAFFIAAGIGELIRRHKK